MGNFTAPPRLHLAPSRGVSPSSHPRVNAPTPEITPAPPRWRSVQGLRDEGGFRGLPAFGVSAQGAASSVTQRGCISHGQCHSGHLAAGGRAGGVVSHFGGGVTLRGWCHTAGSLTGRGVHLAFRIWHSGFPVSLPALHTLLGSGGPPAPGPHFEHNTARRFIHLPKIQGGEGGSGTPHGVKRPFQGSSCRRTGCPRSPRCIPAPRVGHGAGRGKRERSSLHPTKRHWGEGGGKPPAVAGPWSGIVPLGLNSHDSSSGQQNRRSRAGLLQSEG